MKNIFSRIRAMLPTWPSELDVASCQTNWAAMAQEYFNAGIVLREEMNKTREAMHALSGAMLSEEQFRRINLLRPAMFCAAFSLELAAKAARVRVARPEEFSHAKELPFASHMVADICGQLPDFELSDGEKACLRSVSAIISDGKYPTRRRPKSDEVAYMLPSIGSFFETATPIYERLMKYACD